MMSNKMSVASSYRIPLEHALILDTICCDIPADVPLYVVTESPALLQAVIGRHGNIITDEKIGQTVTSHPNTQLTFVEDAKQLPARIERVLLLEPDGTETILNVITRLNSNCRHDCILGNPYSLNRVEERAVTAWCSPIQARAVYRKRRFETEVIGYHGLQSVLRSIYGRIWQALGRPDRRDIYTRRMRNVFKENRPLLAFLSCLVHLQATPQHDE